MFEHEKMKTANNEKTLSEKIDFGIRLGAARAKAEHKRAGKSIVVWQNGEIIKIPPEAIEIPEEFKDMV